MIERFMIEDVYKPGKETESNLKLYTGMCVDLEPERNLLVIGSNGTGKTTLLHMLKESIERHREYEEGEPIELHSVYEKLISAIQDTQSDWQDVGHDEATPQDSWREAVFEGIQTFMPGSEYPFNAEYRCTEKNLESAIQRGDYDWNGQHLEPETQRSMDIAALWVPKYAVEFARENDLEPEVVLGNLAMLETGALARMENEINMWRYVSMSGDVLTPTLSGSYIPAVLDRQLSGTDERNTEAIHFGDAEAVKGSLGEKNKHLINSISEGIWILDEPTNGLDRKDRRTYVQKLIQTKAQVIAATHEDALIDKAEEHPDWQVLDLDEDF